METSSYYEDENTYYSRPEQDTRFNSFLLGFLASVFLGYVGLGILLIILIALSTIVRSGSWKRKALKIGRNTLTFVLGVIAHKLVFYIFSLPW